MNIDWTTANNPPKPNVPILISFENLDYPLNGYYFDWNGKYVVRAQSEYDDDTYAYAFGEVNGWAYLPKCKKNESEVKAK